jgi:hypothetical protein
MNINLLLLLNNQPDALIIPILFGNKTLHVSGIFFAHHREFSTVQSALVSFMQFSDDRLKSVIRNVHESCQCRMCSRKLLMMGREDARHMYSFIKNKIVVISASGWLFKKK